MTAARAAPVRLRIFTREGCHLCAEMVAGLRRLAVDHDLPLALDLVDIDADPTLQARYAGDVPVLEADGRRLCHYHLDQALVLRYLRGDPPGLD